MKLRCVFWVGLRVSRHQKRRAHKAVCSIFLFPRKFSQGLSFYSRSIKAHIYSTLHSFPIFPKKNIHHPIHNVVTLQATNRKN